MQASMRQPAVLTSMKRPSRSATKMPSGACSSRAAIASLARLSSPRARSASSRARWISEMSRVTVPIPRTSPDSGSRIMKWVSETGITSSVCQFRK